MWRTAWPLLAIVSLAAVVAPVRAETRPRYGGTLMLELHDVLTLTDPGDWPAPLVGLVYDRLVHLDDRGRPQPGLASAWTHDSENKRWQFTIRAGAKFQDGSAITAAGVRANLKSWSNVEISGEDSILIQTDKPAPDVPVELAGVRNAILHRGGDGVTIGSGPFRITEWQAGRHAVFTANEDYWGGRPFADSIEFQMGSTLRDQLMDRQLGSYAATELSVDQIRNVEQNNQTVTLSRPADLLALVFLQPESGGRPGKKPVDARVRQALGLTMNRAAISNVIFQRKGLPASGLLPQWLTGYEFMFSGATDMNRAKELRADAAAFVVIGPIALAYDFADPLARLAAERIAVDAREAGIVVQPYAESHLYSKPARASMNADAVLLRVPLQSLDPSIALAARMDDLGLPLESAPAILGATRPEDLLEIERKLLESNRVLPVAHIPQVLWLNNAAHNWKQDLNGAWNLDQLWMEGAR